MVPVWGSVAGHCKIFATYPAVVGLELWQRRRRMSQNFPLNGNLIRFRRSWMSVNFVCDKMTLNQTLGRIFKMLEAMSRLPCGLIVSTRCRCSDVRSLSQRAAHNSYRQNCWCESREIWKNRSAQLFVPCPCRLLVPLPGTCKLPKCPAYPYQWLPGVPKLTYAQTSQRSLKELLKEN